MAKYQSRFNATKYISMKTNLNISNSTKHMINRWFFSDKNGLRSTFSVSVPLKGRK